MNKKSAKKLTVLLAEDDEMLRGMVAEILSGGGYRVLAAEDGQAAWEKITAQGADMAVLDCNMPRLDGLALTKRLRKDPRFSGMPIMMLTVKSMVEDQLVGYGSGIDDYLPKPFDDQVLLARLKVLARRILSA
ncbi:MAG TPA: response regulator transcription factor [Elusimicrobiota bacterium]|nr:response regulator transcription factor [Elusimicrobiota bacterium]